ncbi:MAG TPA: sigma-54 dependent transcriptional regulator [Candidatus Bathyarchaeia archaeon]|nr:sigma-54 dependent transcriptional regulator [Candidatus Bathyarchaeia archaeon]
MKSRILVVDDERTICIAIQRLLVGRGHEVDTALSGEEGIEKLGREPYHLVVTDLNLKKLSGMELLQWVKRHSPETAVIMITAYGSEKIAVEAMKVGAADYLPKPFDNEELELVVERALEGMTLRRDLRLLQEKVQDSYRFENIIGKSAAMQRVFDVIRKVADTDLTVLIRGPSGTGKELVANALHYNSPRRSRPLVKVNCAAFSRELVESELFGHEKGAFTGAAATREGKFEVADKGTLFLDEIGDMSLETQAKILRVLQEKEVERVGGNRTIKVDVRIIAATNHDLEAKVKDASFREDLYYRLNVVPIVLPPLRERTGDLPLLIDHFLTTVATRLRRDVKSLVPEAYRALCAHEWKGNVRELEHALEQAVALASSSEIALDDLPASVRGAEGAAIVASAANAGAAGDGGAPPEQPGTFREAKQQVIERFERQFILQALERHHGNVSKAAEEMGMYRQHLQLKLAEYGIDPATYRMRER